MEWSPPHNVGGQPGIKIDNIQEGDTVNQKIGRVSGGKPPYTLAIMKGTWFPSMNSYPLSEYGPFYIYGKEDGEYDPSIFAIIGTADGIDRDACSVTLVLQDSIGQTKTAPLSFGAQVPALALSVISDISNFILVKGVSDFDRKPTKIIEAVNGSGGYQYSTILGPLNGGYKVVDGVYMDSNGVLHGKPTTVADQKDLTNIFRVEDSNGRQTQVLGGKRFVMPKVTEEISAGEWDGIVNEIKLNDTWSSPAIFTTNGHTITTSYTGAMPLAITLQGNQLVGRFTKAFEDEKKIVVTGTRAENVYTPAKSLTQEVVFNGVADGLQYVVKPLNLAVPVLSLNKPMSDVIVSEGRTGGLAPFSWTVSPELPAGLSIITEDQGRVAKISGTPTEVYGVTSFTITVTDSAGSERSITIPFKGVYEPLIFENKGGKMNIPNMEANEVYSAEYKIMDMISGGVGPFAFWDENLSPYYIDRNTGVISGNSGIDSQEAKKAIIYVRDAGTGQEAQVEIDVGKINGILSFVKDTTPYDIPGGKVAGQPIEDIPLINGVLGGQPPYKFVIGSVSSWGDEAASIQISDMGIINGKYPMYSRSSGNVSISIYDNTGAYITITVKVGEVTGGIIRVRDDVALNIKSGVGEDEIEPINLLDAIIQGDETTITWTLTFDGSSRWKDSIKIEGNYIVGTYPVNTSATAAGEEIPSERVTVTGVQSGTTIEFEVLLERVEKSNLRFDFQDNAPKMKQNTETRFELTQYTKGYPKTYTYKVTGLKINGNDQTTWPWATIVKEGDKSYLVLKPTFAKDSRAYELTLEVTNDNETITDTVNPVFE